jgi:hypothetical protein
MAGDIMIIVFLLMIGAFGFYAGTHREEEHKNTHNHNPRK